jgi:hypothetical protein
MPSRFLSDYLSRYGGVRDWHLPAFQLVNDRFSPRKVLYPGSWVHLTPSLVFPYVVYVDSSNIERAFHDPDLVRYIEKHSTHHGKPEIIFHHADYKSSFGEEKTSFDLLISLSSGLISQSCGSYLKEGGVFFTNDEHYDASLAYTNPGFKLIGVFNTAKNYIESEEIIQSYFITTKGEPISPEMVKENIQRPPSKARYRLKKKALFYTFRRLRG